MVTHITQTDYYNQLLGEGQRLPVPYYGDSLLQKAVTGEQKIGSSRAWTIIHLAETNFEAPKRSDTHEIQKACFTIGRQTL